MAEPCARRILCTLLLLLATPVAEGSVLQLVHGSFNAHALRQLHRRTRFLEQSALDHHDDWDALAGLRQYVALLPDGLGHEELRRTHRGVEDAGGVVSQHLPEAALLLLLPDFAAGEVAALPHVLHVSPYRPEWRVEPQLRRLTAKLEEDLYDDRVQAGRNCSSLPEELEEHLGSTEWHMKGCQPQVVLQATFPAVPWLRSSAAIAANETGAMPSQVAQKHWSGEIARAVGAGIELKAVGSKLEITAPVATLPALLRWLARQPLLHWVGAKPRYQLHNYRTASVIQSGIETGRLASDPSDAIAVPLWVAGLRGHGQIVGLGDSGLDMESCFFADPDNPFQPLSGSVYSNAAHRKVVLYRGQQDSVDLDGHGTHVAGIIAGAASSSDARVTGGSGGLQDAAAFQGMAPEAKLAFLDVSYGRWISVPSDLSRDYYSRTYQAGARIHSDSWGAPGSSRRDLAYGSDAMEVDEFTWQNHDFLVIFAAGNDGEESETSSEQNLPTVKQPATAKNCISVGASLSSWQTAFHDPSLTKYAASVQAEDGMEGLELQLLQAAFGGDFGVMARSSASFSLQAVDPRDACTEPSNAARLQGVVALLERGGCFFADKLRNVQRAGARAAIMTNNDQGGFFKMEAAASQAGLGFPGIIAVGLTIPMGSVPLSVGRKLWKRVEESSRVMVTFRLPAAAPPSFESLSRASSNGPTQDGRVKPDLVAPGLAFSARSNDRESTTAESCAVVAMAGTSMSAPVVAGAAALVRQYFMDGYYPSGRPSAADIHTPSGPLLKAVILAGAAPMLGDTEAGLPLEPPPSFRQGFGRLHLGRALPLEGSGVGWRLQVVDLAELSRQGEVHQYCIEALGGPLRVLLTWYDPPSSPAAAKNLVNDLDLSVRSAGLRTQLLGNDKPGGDRTNNVEVVDVPDMPRGHVSVQVSAHRLPSPSLSPQRYALVVLGRMTASSRLASPHNPAAGADAASGQCVITLVQLTSSPPALTRSRSLRFEFTVSAGPSSSGFECLLADPEGEVNADGSGPTHSWRSCSSPATYENVPDGKYQFAVRAVDEEVAESHVFIVDATPPATTFVDSQSGLPPATSAAQVAVFQFEAEDASPVSFQCLLTYDGPVASSEVAARGPENEPLRLGEWANCSSPFMAWGLVVGSYDLTVRGTDTAGNVEEGGGARYSWAVAMEPGVTYTRITNGVFGRSASKNLSYSLMAVQVPPGGGEVPIDVSGQVVFETQLLPAAFVDSASSDSGAGEDAGNSTVASLQGRRLAGRKLQQLQVHDLLDCNAERAADGLWQQADGSEVVLADLDDGPHCFFARTVDPSGNAGDAVAAVPAVVDTTPAELSNVDGPGLFVPGAEVPSGWQGNPNGLRVQPTPSAMVSFESNEGGATFQCRLRRVLPEEEPLPEWQPCPITVPGTLVLEDLQDGVVYSLSMRAVDAVGNVGLQVRRDFLVDTASPMVTITQPLQFPAATTNSSFQLSFTTEDSSGGSGVNASSTQCFVQRAQGGVAAPPSASGAEPAAPQEPQQEQQPIANGTRAVIAPCTSPLQVEAEEEGLYLLQVEAEDVAGHTGATPQLQLFVDRTAPQQAQIVAGPAGSTPQPSCVDFRWTAADTGPAASNVTSGQCRLDLEPVEVMQPGSGASDGGLRALLQAAGAAGSVPQRHLLQSGGSITMRPGGEAVMLATWMPCELGIVGYKGLPSEKYELRVRGVDRAGNVGPESDPRAFSVDSALAGSCCPGEDCDAGSSNAGLPPWLLYIIIGGGVLVVAVTLLALGLWWRRRATRRELELELPEEPPSDVVGYSQVQREDPVLRAALRASRRQYEQEQQRRQQQLQPEGNEPRLAEALRQSVEAAAAAQQLAHGVPVADSPPGAPLVVHNPAAAPTAPSSQWAQQDRRMQQAMQASRDEDRVRRAMEASLQDQEEEQLRRALQQSLTYGPIAPPLDGPPPPQL